MKTDKFYENESYLVYSKVGDERKVVTTATAIPSKRNDKIGFKFKNTELLKKVYPKLKMKSFYTQKTLRPINSQKDGKEFQFVQLYCYDTDRWLTINSMNVEEA